MIDNPESPEFWNQRYRDHRTAWDCGSAPPDLLAYLQENPGGDSKVFIPGCGSGYEIVAFRNAGYQVQAIELSEAAITHAQQTIGSDSECIQLGDFFQTNHTLCDFDIVYDRTFHCALPPQRRSEYLKRMDELIRPGGLLLGLFLYGHESEPPPYPMPPQILKSAFAPLFSLQTTRPGKDPIPMHQNKEHWQIWQKSAR